MSKHKTVYAAVHTVHALETVIARYNQGVTLSEIAKTIRVSVPATFHLVQTLIQERCIMKKDQSGRYYPGPRLFHWAKLISCQDWFEKVIKVMEKIINYPEGNSSISVYYCEQKDDEVVIRHQIRQKVLGLETDVNQTLSPYISIGSLIHLAYWSSSAREKYYQLHPIETSLFDKLGNLHSILETIRQNGYFIQENPHQLRIGFPAFDATGLFHGSFTISWNYSSNLSVSQIRESFLVYCQRCVESLRTN